MAALKQSQTYKTLENFDFSALSNDTLEFMQQGVAEMLDVLEQSAGENYSILSSVLTSADNEPFTQWQHYPPGDVEDRDEGAIWFYHAHEEDKLARPWDEHGHFHLFVYSEHAPVDARILALPEDPDHENGGLCHLVAVSFSREGVPIQLFTVNRWVAMEWQYDAETVISMLDHFRIENAHSGKDQFQFSSRWLMALLKLYRPQIEWAIRERDSMIDRIKADDPDGWSENENIEVLSAVTFDLAGQIDNIESELARRDS